jgi:hypothetical protein
MTLATVARQSIEVKQPFAFCWLSTPAYIPFQYSEMNPEEKVSALEIWDRRWQLFVQEIVNKNGML